jgi:hypothetical protein
LKVDLIGGRIKFDERLTVSFHRTLRLPENGGVYPLPPGLGLLPVKRSGSGSGTLELLVPLFRREALWIGFSATAWKPNAVKIIAGGINAVSGQPDDACRLDTVQNYVVCPNQPWIDGCNIGGGVIRQFVAMPLGQGYGLGANTPSGEKGGLDISAFDPLPGHFPDAPPPPPPGPIKMARAIFGIPAAEEMTLGAGGRMRQKIYPDPFGHEIWDPGAIGRAHVQLIDARDWRSVTGEEVPPSPIDTEAYTRAGLPWFDIYDEGEPALAPTAPGSPKTIGERDRELGDAEPDRPMSVDKNQVTTIGHSKIGAVN